jgi:hypothetical protein
MTEIKINASQWNAISDDEKNKIIEGLRSTGALQAEDVIIRDNNVPELTAETVLQPMSNPLKDICKAGCDVIATGALAWCTAHTAGLGLTVCVAAAEKVREHCKSRC